MLGGVYQSLENAENKSKFVLAHVEEFVQGKGERRSVAQILFHVQVKYHLKITKVIVALHVSVELSPAVG